MYISLSYYQNLWLCYYLFIFPYFQSDFLMYFFILSEALVAVGNQKSFANLRPWLPEEVPTFMENYHIVDHHHNIVRRLDLLPPTHRGQIIRKMLAHFHFQEFLGKGILSDTADEKTSIIPHVGAKEAWGLLRKNMNKFKLYNQEYYAMMSMIRLLDAIVGNEPFMDFKEKTYDEAIKHIKDHLERVSTMYSCRYILYPPSQCENHCLSSLSKYMSRYVFFFTV